MGNWATQEKKSPNKRHALKSPTPTHETRYAGAWANRSRCPVYPCTVHTVHYQTLPTLGVHCLTPWRATLANHTTRPGYHRPPSLRAARRPHVTPHSKTLQACTPTPPPALAAQSSVRYSRLICSAFQLYHPKTTQKMYSRLDEVEKGNPVGVVVCGARDARIMRAPTPDPRPPTPTHMGGSNANREKRCSNPNPNPEPQPQTPLRFVVHQRLKCKNIDSTCELHFSATLAWCLIRSLNLCVFPWQWRQRTLWPQRQQPSNTACQYRHGYRQPIL